MRFKGDVCLELLGVGVSGTGSPVPEGFLQGRDLGKLAKTNWRSEAPQQFPIPILIMLPCKHAALPPSPGRGERLCTVMFLHGTGRRQVQSCTHLQSRAVPFGKGAGVAYSQLGLFQVYSWQYQRD